MNRINQLLLSQSTNIDDYSSCRLKLENYLAFCQGKSKEKTTNFFWQLITLLRIKNNFLISFNYLKSDKFYESWCILETIEIDLNNLLDNSNKEFFIKYKLDFYRIYVEKWQSLFPYKIFLSMGFIASDFHCSICGHLLRPRNQCVHKKGKIYDGELCIHICSKIDDILEVSFVKNPMQKCCIIIKDYDYSLLQSLIQRLNSPFDGWYYFKTKIQVQRDNFNEVCESSPCPCQQNDKNFKDCCFNKSEIEIPHIEFILEKTFSEELPDLILPNY